MWFTLREDRTQSLIHFLDALDSEHRCVGRISVLDGVNNTLLLGVPNLPESAEQQFLRGVRIVTS